MSSSCRRSCVWVFYRRAKRQQEPWSEINTPGTRSLLFLCSVRDLPICPGPIRLCPSQNDQKGVRATTAKSSGIFLVWVFCRRPQGGVLTIGEREGRERAVACCLVAHAHAGVLSLCVRACDCGFVRVTRARNPETRYATSQRHHRPYNAAALRGPAFSFLNYYYSSSSITTTNCVSALLSLSSPPLSF